MSRISTLAQLRERRRAERGQVGKPMSAFSSKKSGPIIAVLAER